MVAPSAPRDARSKIPPGPEGSNGIDRRGRRGQPAGPPPFWAPAIARVPPTVARLPSTLPGYRRQPTHGRLYAAGVPWWNSTRHAASCSRHSELRSTARWRTPSTTYQLR